MDSRNILELKDLLRQIEEEVEMSENSEGKPINWFKVEDLAWDIAFLANSITEII